MDIEGYLFGSGFGLLIVLLGWANQLTTKNQETKDLENQFLKKAKLLRSDFQKMINEGGASEDSFDKLMDLLFSTERDHVRAFVKIKAIRSDVALLEKKYGRRFWLLTFLSILLFLTGIVSIMTPPEYKLWMLAPSFILIAFVFLNLIAIYRIEKRYTQTLNDAMEIL
jgi:hypothetical protein